MKQTGLLLLCTLVFISSRADTVISVSAPTFESAGCVSLFTGQGYRVGWTQPDTYDAVSISANLTSNGEANQTGRAFLTTQIGAGTSGIHQIASTAFTFPVNVTKVVLFQGLRLSPGSYYLSIIGDSPGWASCWANAATNTFTQRGVSSLGGFGALSAPSAYFPATPFVSEFATPPEYTIQGINLTRPILQIIPNSSTVSVSWTTNAVGYSLQTASSLALGNWQTVQQGITINSGRFVFTTNSIGPRFYRLRKPVN